MGETSGSSKAKKGAKTAAKKPKPKATAAPEVHASAAAVEYTPVEGSWKDITVEKVLEGHYAVVSFNRPDKLNAFTTETLYEISGALEQLELDADVRCAVLRGTKNVTKKPSFTVGRDLGVPFRSELKPNVPMHMDWLVFDQHRACDRIEAFPKPLIVAVDGYALGGGTELTCIADLSIASKRSIFGVTEIVRGLLPAMGGTQRLARYIGLGRAKWMVYTGSQVPAQQMFDWGLLSKVVEDADFEDEVHALASKIGNGPTTAYYVVKKCINFGTQVPLSIGLKFEDMAYAENSQASDLAEGIRAFFLKKDPEFKGV